MFVGFVLNGYKLFVHTIKGIHLNKIKNENNENSSVVIVI